MFLTQQYMGLSPFEIMKRDYREVLDIYVHTIIHLFGKQNKKQDKVWVTSKNASWH